MKKVEKILRLNNRLVETYKMMQEVEKEERSKLAPGQEMPVVTLRFHNDMNRKNTRLTPLELKNYSAPVANEIAAVFVTDEEGQVPRADIVVHNRATKKLEQLKTYDPNIEAMTYPMILPTGKAGWRNGMKCRNPRTNVEHTISHREFINYRLHPRKDEFNPIFHAGKLGQQWVVDLYTHWEAERSECEKRRQAEQLVSTMKTLRQNQDVDHIREVMKSIKMPATWAGSPRWYRKCCADAIAIVNKFIKADLFITMTMNPEDPDLLEAIRYIGYDGTPRTHKVADRPDIVARVFRLKMKRLLDCLIKEQYFGKVLGHIGTVEWQKRGLPHCHIIIFLADKDKLNSAEKVDYTISAQIPNKDEDPELYELVSKHMFHGPCAPYNLRKACMEKGKCSKHYPKEFSEYTELTDDGYPTYARPDNGRTVEKILGQERRRVYLDNRWVVPHNATLLKEFKCHINVECVWSFHLLTYLCKYLHKGVARALVTLYLFGDPGQYDIVDPRNQVEVRDEIQEHIDARYLSAPEAVHRMFTFPIQVKYPKVITCHIHLPGEQYVYLKETDTLDDDALENIEAKDSKLMGYFRLNDRTSRFYDADAANYTYDEIPENYTWDDKKKNWHRAGRYTGNIGTVYFVTPRAAELFFMRTLLLNVKGPKSFEDLRTVRTVDGVEKICDSFRDACLELKLIHDDQETSKSLDEARQRLNPPSLRNFFVLYLLHCEPVNPLELWIKFRKDLASDFLHLHKDQEELAYRWAYSDIVRRYERESDREIGDNYPDMANLYEPIGENMTIDRAVILEQGIDKYGKLNDAQKKVVDDIMSVVDNRTVGNRCFFIYGSAGTGKTFTYETVYELAVGKGKTVRCMAPTGISAALLTEGKTVHSTIGAPVPMYADSNSKFSPRDKFGRRLMDTDIFIIDEGPMMSRYLLELLDRTLRKFHFVLGPDGKAVDHPEPFAGKVVLIGGDFKQLMPVCPGASEAELIGLSIVSSPLWDHFNVYKLEKIQRLDEGQVDFRDLLLKIGEGTLESDENGEVELPLELFTENDLVKEIYGEAIETAKAIDNYEALHDTVILCPLNKEVQEINEKVLEMLPGVTRTYLSTNEIEDDRNNRHRQNEGRNMYPVEFLNKIENRELQPHVLNLKPHCIAIVTRNLSQEMGIVNGSRVEVLECLDRRIECKLLNGSKKGDIVSIPIIKLRSSEKMPFILSRRQFPLRLAFALTINRSQGQTLRRVGLYLYSAVFNHGQLYTGTTRTRNKESLTIKVNPEKGKGCRKVVNVVSKELLEKVKLKIRNRT